MKKQLILTLLFSALFLIGCDDDEPIWRNHNIEPRMTITSFYPESGASGIVVTIFGETFGSSVSDNYVTFNGIYSEILQVQPGIVTVRVPTNLREGDYEIYLSAHGQTVTSTKTFKVNPY